MTTYILSDAERYGDLERILSAAEPLCPSPVSYKPAPNRSRRPIFGLGWRMPARPTGQAPASDLMSPADIRQQR